VWAHDLATGKPVTYGNVRLAEELQVSVYNFEAADVDKAWKHLELYEAECQSLIDSYNRLHGSKSPTRAKDVSREAAMAEKKRFPLLGAYELCLNCSNLFNILDARGAISVTERVGVIARIRQLAVGVAKAWVDQQSHSPVQEVAGEVQTHRNAVATANQLSS
jgi:glycyl-tRNA synthetase alpha chain